MAYDPPTRHTRADNYLGVSMEFALFRNTSHEQIRDIIRAWSKEEKEALEENKIPTKGSLASSEIIKLSPGIMRRKKGTLQRGIIAVSNGRWVYDENPLVLAVICQRNWAPVDVTHQRYALIASVWHENDNVKLYTHIRQHARIYQRVRARV